MEASPHKTNKNSDQDGKSGKATGSVSHFFCEFFLGVKLAFPGTWFRGQNQSRTEDVTEYF